jgi:hypothetical protein
MRKRLALLVFFPFVLLGIALVWPVFHDREPAYKGYPLRTWVEALGRLDLQERAPRGLPQWTRDDIYLAVKQTGTNAFPYLLDWLCFENTSARTGFAASVRRFFSASPSRPIAEIRAFGAARAIQYLEVGAAPLIPGLVRLMNDPALPDTAERVMDTLAYVGTNGLPYLIAFLNNPANPHRRSAAVAMSAICKLGPHARPAIPSLIQCLQDPDSNLAARAANTLGIIAFQSTAAALPLKLESASVVPALKSALYSLAPAVRACSASALIAFPEQAADTLPALTNLLSDPERSVRAAASNAIFHLHTHIGAVESTIVTPRK